MPGCSGMKSTRSIRSARLEAEFSSRRTPFLRQILSMPIRRCLVPGLLLPGITFLMLTGCQKTDEIVSYTVAKPAAHQRNSETGGKSHSNDSEPATEGATTDRLVGAIVPRGATTWFFKLTGPASAVRTQDNAFEQFIKSIRFTEKGPAWALPSGWKEEPGTAMRFATLRITTPEGRLELSVIPLPTGEGRKDAYLLSNVNRWRDQLRLPPIKQDELAEKTVQFEIEGAPAWMVAFEGRLTQQQMGGSR